jgi:hypothetical protein
MQSSAEISAWAQGLTFCELFFDRKSLIRVLMPNLRIFFKFLLNSMQSSAEISAWAQGLTFYELFFDKKSWIRVLMPMVLLLYSGVTKPSWPVYLTI